MVGTKPSYALTEYGGSYGSRVYGSAKIRYRDGKLTLHLGAHPSVVGVLSHWHHETFVCKWRNCTFGESFVYFDFDDDMEIKQFRVKVRPDWVDTHEYTFVKARQEH